MAFCRAKSETWQPPIISGFHIQIILLGSLMSVANIFHISPLYWGTNYSRWGTVLLLLVMLTG